jgi:hypothetical protein
MAASASANIEITSGNVDPELLQFFKLIQKNKLIIRSAPEKKLNSKTECPCAVRFVTVRTASDAIQRNRDVYIMTTGDKDCAYQKCTRPLYYNKETKETQEYCFKHWETHMKSSANIFNFEDIIKNGRKATLEDPFFNTANVTGRKKSGAKKSSDKPRNRDIRIELTPEIYTELMRIKSILESSASSASSSSASSTPSMEIKKKDDETNADDNESIIDNHAEETADAPEEAEEADEDAEEESEEEFEVEEIETRDGRKLGVNENTMKVYDTNSDDNDELGVLVIVESSSDNYAVDFNDKKYIVGVPFEHDEKEFYHCIITNTIYSDDNPAKLVGSMKIDAKGKKTPKFNPTPAPAAKKAAGKGKK